MAERSWSLEHMMEAYLRRIELEGKSPNTVVAYRETLTQFLEVAKENGFDQDVRRITPEHVDCYLAWVKGRGVSDDTRHRRFRECRFLFVWLERNEYIRRNPFEHLRNIKLPQRIVQPIRPEDIVSLLEATYPNPIIAARNKAIILVLLDTGMRLNELISLSLDDVDISHQRIRILHAKMKKQRVVAVGDTALEALLHYLDIRGDEPGQLFLSSRGKAIRPNSIRVMLRHLAERAGVPHVYPHKFRHIFATWAIESQATERDVQLLLGHSTGVMVRRYSSTYDAEKAAKSHARWSPGDRLGSAAK